MMGVPRKAELAQQVADFANRCTPAEARWEYAYGAARHVYIDRAGHRSDSFSDKSMPVLGRFLGVGPTIVGMRLRRMRDHETIAAAREDYLASRHWEKGREPFAVGPMEPWQIGHVYFARVVDFPHVVKVGFSRRVRERLEDIEGKNRTRLDPFVVKVGTLADEHWWHHNWRSLRISGEWFFDPRSLIRTVPDFLAAQKQAA